MHVNRKHLLATLQAASALLEQQGGRNEDIQAVKLSVVQASDKDHALTPQDGNTYLKITMSQLKGSYEALLIVDQQSNKAITSVVVSREELIRCLRGLTGSQIFIEEDQQGLVLASEKITFHIPLFQDEVTPESLWNSNVHSAPLRLSLEELHRALPSASYACAVNDTRLSLTGLHLEKPSEKNQLHLVATDSYRLAHEVITSKHNNHTYSIPLPIHLKHLLKAWQEGDLSITYDKGWLQLEHAEFQLRLHHNPGLFPNWRQLITDSGRKDPSVVLDRVELWEALKAAQAIVGKNGIITLRINQHHFILKARQHGGMTMKTSITSEDQGVLSNLKIQISGAFLREALQHIPMSEQVRLVVGSEPSSPIILLAEDENPLSNLESQAFSLIMPVLRTGDHT